MFNEQVLTLNTVLYGVKYHCKVKEMREITSSNLYGKNPSWMAGIKRLCITALLYVLIEIELIGLVMFVRPWIPLAVLHFIDWNITEVYDNEMK